MGKYTAIADVSEEILRVMRKQLATVLIPDQNSIGLCSPENCTEYSLSIYLYDLQESEEVRTLGMMNLDDARQKGPPVYLSLYYMMTACLQSDQKFKVVQEERILGQIIQYFHDYPKISAGGEETRMQMLRISTEDKMKLWNFGKAPYAVSLFYKASPVVIDSAYIRSVSRVRRPQIQVGRLEERDGILYRNK